MTQGKFAIVDSDYVHVLRKFSWRAVQAKSSWYARTTIGPHDKQAALTMHRFIARTPFGMVCHHINGNSLDNRRTNLKNVTKKDHDMLHANKKLLIKYAALQGI